jgi:hypothetical protein
VGRRGAFEEIKVHFSDWPIPFFSRLDSPFGRGGKTHRPAFSPCQSSLMGSDLNDSDVPLNTSVEVNNK